MYSEPSERAMTAHSSTLAWKIPWTEESGSLQSRGSLRIRYNWATSLSLFTFMHWRRKWQPTPVFLPGESQGWGSLVGCRLWGHTVRYNWSDLAAAAAFWTLYMVVSIFLGWAMHCSLFTISTVKTPGDSPVYVSFFNSLSTFITLSTLWQMPYLGYPLQFS